MRSKSVRAALISMPFVSVAKGPSIQLGLLKSLAARRGYLIDCYHFCIDFSVLVGVNLYESLCDRYRGLDGEWLFSLEAFGAEAPDPNSEYLDSEHRRSNDGIQVDALRQLRTKVVPAYLGYLCSKVSWGQYDVVGFTSTFQQNVASFALARRLKDQWPKVLTLFGGANFDGEMGIELVHSVPQVDYAVIGEADVAFPAFLDALSSGENPLSVSGVVARASGSATSPAPRASLSNLADSPTPDYSDYFDQAYALKFFDARPKEGVWLPFESSRGCWWGEKQHCIFCGLNGAAMSFRVKPPTKTIEQLTELATKHGISRFFAVDNIVSTTYFDNFFDKLADQEQDFAFFYEVKSNLTRDRIRRLRRAGVREIQPGIESFNSSILSLMRKGVRAIQNVNTLRWSCYYGIQTAYNILWGFPGESLRAYDEQCALIPLLSHLPPPTGFGRMWMERFSPAFSQRHLFPTKYLRPEKSYSYVYPATVVLERAAYFFDYQFVESHPDEAYDCLIEAIQAWQLSWNSGERPTLTFSNFGTTVFVDDRRNVHDPKSFSLVGIAAKLFAACSDKPRHLADLSALLELTPIEAQHSIEVLAQLVADKLMLQEGPQYLSLALPAAQDQ